MEAASASVTWLKLNNLHSSHGPDHQLQRRQRVYRHQGVQHALVLVQINRNVVVFYKSLLKILDPSGQLTYFLHSVLTNHGFQVLICVPSHRPELRLRPDQSDRLAVNLNSL